MVPLCDSNVWRCEIRKARPLGYTLCCRTDHIDLWERPWRWSLWGARRKADRMVRDMNLGRRMVETRTVQDHVTAMGQ